MCRFICYCGPEVLLHDVIVKTEHSLIVQSKHATKREDPVNGDGFGVGWYPNFDDPTPGVFKSIEPAWNNRNLYYVTSKIRSQVFFGHVRDASTELPVSQSNCHPFQYGHFLWMHNGWLVNFNRMKRLLIEHLSDRAFLTIQGNTDSEFAFAMFLDEIDFNDHANQSQMEQALMNVIDKLTFLRIKAGLTSNAQMNFAVSNGKIVLATRFSTIVNQQPASLYYLQGQLQRPSKDSVVVLPDNQSIPKAVVIASEPLSSSGEFWQKVPRNHLIATSRHGDLKISPLTSVDS